MTIPSIRMTNGSDKRAPPPPPYEKGGKSEREIDELFDLMHGKGEKKPRFINRA